MPKRQNKNKAKVTAKIRKTRSTLSDVMKALGVKPYELKKLSVEDRNDLKRALDIETFGM